MYIILEAAGNFVKDRYVHVVQRCAHNQQIDGSRKGEYEITRPRREKRTGPATGSSA